MLSTCAVTIGVTNAPIVPHSISSVYPCLMPDDFTHH
jgi:hypothetical protein